MPKNDKSHSYLRGVSLFSGAGIGELKLRAIGAKIETANELLIKRANLYSAFHPDTKMIQGDLRNKEVKKAVLESAKKAKCNFLIATPPCQGMSSLGKKEDNDIRNTLIFDVLEIIDAYDFDMVLIENVPKLLKITFTFNGKKLGIVDILKSKYGGKYSIDSAILNAKDYGVPQSRPRAIIKMFKIKVFDWEWPKKKKEISLKTAIGWLPSLEAGQKSEIKFHWAKIHNEREIEAVRHTREGTSAIANEIHFPRKPSGERIKGFHNTYKRMKWDEPSPARAMNNGSLGGHNNIHPGILRKDGTTSDARVLTLRELFIVSSVPSNIKLPSWCTDNLIRQVIGEAVPPRLCLEIMKTIRLKK